MSRWSEPASDRGIGVFMTDRDVVDGTVAHIAGVHRALLAATRRIATPQGPPQYLRTIYVPSEQRCLSFFEAIDLQTVRAIHDTAQFPDARICEALEYCGCRPGEDRRR